MVKNNNVDLGSLRDMANLHHAPLTNGERQKRDVATVDLEAVWPLLAPHGWVNWFAKRGKQRAGGVLRSAQSLGRAVQNMPGWNWYVGMNPARPHGIKARRQDVLAFEKLLVDIDPVTCDLAPHAAAEDVVLALWRLGLPTGAITVLDSGRGLHLWLHFEHRGIASQEEAVDIERRCNALLRHLSAALPPEHGCRIDTCTSDLPRVARLPGSVNQGTGRPARVLSLGGGRAPRSVLQSFVPAAPPERQRPSDVGNLAAVLPHLSWRATQFLKLGVEQGGRHAAAVAAARSLREAGVPHERALAWMLEGAQRALPALPVSEVTIITHKQYGRI